MAEDQEDKFASIVAHCRISPSQEDLLSLSNFAREGEAFSDGGGKSPAVAEDSGESCKELSGAGGDGARDSGEFVAVCAECEEIEGLGFSGNSDVKLERSCKKARVSGLKSPNLKEDSGKSCKELKSSGDAGGRDSGEVYVAVCAECEEIEGLGFSGNSDVKLERSCKKARVSGLKSPNLKEDSGKSCKELKSSGDAGGRDSGEVYAECEETNDLGFSNQRRTSNEPLSKKPRVSGLKSPNFKGGRVSPVVQCTEKMVIGNEDNNRKQMMVIRSEVKVEILTPDSIHCCAKSGSGDGNGKQIEVRGESSAKKKLDFEKEEENGSKNGEFEKEEEKVMKNGEIGDADTGNKEGIANGDNADRSENPKDDGIRRDGEKHEGVERKGKRELPRSLLEQVWGTTPNRGEGAKAGVSGKTMENENGKAKAGETLRHFFDVLRILAVDSRYNDDCGEVDIFETVKRRGMTFPQNRFQSRTKED